MQSGTHTVTAPRSRPLSPPERVPYPLREAIPMRSPRPSRCNRDGGPGPETPPEDVHEPVRRGQGRSCNRDSERLGNAWGRGRGRAQGRGQGGGLGPQKGSIPTRTSKMNYRSPAKNNQNRVKNPIFPHFAPAGPTGTHPRSRPEPIPARVYDCVPTASRLRPEQTLKSP